MNLFKALIPGTVLAFVVSGLIGSGHSRGGWLAIHRLSIDGHGFYWSWVMFGIGVVLSWAIITITPK